MWYNKSVIKGGGKPLKPQKGHAMTSSTTTTKTPTKKEMFADVIALAEGRPTKVSPVMIAEFAAHEIELLEKKAATPRKPTATQIENESLKAAIVGYLTSADAPKTIKEMQADVEVLAPLSNQRITHLLTDLRKAGTVARTYVKKVAYFSIGTEDPTEVESND